MAVCSEDYVPGSKLGSTRSGQVESLCVLTPATRRESSLLESESVLLQTNRTPLSRSKVHEVRLFPVFRD